MTYPVLLEPIPDQGYLATALGLPDCTCIGVTEEAAIRGVRAALTERLSRSKVVQVEVPPTGDPWAKWVGYFASDATWEEFQELMTANRKELDRELGR